MQIASEAIRLTFKHWPLSKGSQDSLIVLLSICISLPTMRLWLEVTFWGTRRGGEEPRDNVVTPVCKAFVWPSTQNAMGEGPGHCQPPADLVPDTVTLCHFCHLL